MGKLNFGWPKFAVASLLAGLALGACSTTPSPQVDNTPAVAPLNLYIASTKVEVEA